VLLPGSTTRQEDSNRFKRREPRWPANGLTPTSPHGHGTNDARHGDYCGAYDCVHERDQVEIERSKADPPVNPEDRAQRKIDEYRQAMESLDPNLHPRLIAGLQAKIDEQRKIIDEWAGVPTVYRPDPRYKGGKS
jgi:hypothetical protein